MGVGAGLYVYVVVVQKFMFAISSPDEFLYKQTATHCTVVTLHPTPEGFPWDDLRKIFCGCQRMAKVPNGKCRRNIAENFNRLSRAHERYRQTNDRQTDGRQHIANVNVSSRSLKIA